MTSKIIQIVCCIVFSVTFTGCIPNGMIANMLGAPSLMEDPAADGDPDSSLSVDIDEENSGLSVGNHLDASGDVDGDWAEDIEEVDEDYGVGSGSNAGSPNRVSNGASADEDSGDTNYDGDILTDGGVASLPVGPAKGSDDCEDLSGDNTLLSAEVSAGSDSGSTSLYRRHLRQGFLAYNDSDDTNLFGLKGSGKKDSQFPFASDASKFVMPHRSDDKDESSLSDIISVASFTLNPATFQNKKDLYSYLSFEHLDVKKVSIPKIALTSEGGSLPFVSLSLKDQDENQTCSVTLEDGTKMDVPVSDYLKEHGKIIFTYFNSQNKMIGREDVYIDEQGHYTAVAKNSATRIVYQFYLEENDSEANGAQSTSIIFSTTKWGKKNIHVDFSYNGASSKNRIKVMLDRDVKSQPHSELANDLTIFAQQYRAIMENGDIKEAQKIRTTPGVISDHENLGIKYRFGENTPSSFIFLIKENDREVELEEEI